MFNTFVHYTGKINYFIYLCLLTILIPPSHADTQPVFKIGELEKIQDMVTKNILIEAYQKLNIEIKFTHLPAERSLILANAGILDAEGSRLAGLEKNYPNLIMIKIPLEIISLSAYSKNEKIKIQGWQSLKAYKIAYLRGVKIIEKNIAGFNAEKVSDINQAFAMLEHDRVDLVIADDYQGNNAIAQDNEIKKLTPPVYEFPVYHYIHKKHADLVPKLESVLAEMVKEKKN